MLLVNTHRPSGEEVGQREHYTCAIVGLLATLVVLAAAFTPIVVFVSRFGVLAATAVVALVFLWWAVWWETTELALVRLGNSEQ